jgi:hypothetical protein
VGHSSVLIGATAPGVLAFQDVARALAAVLATLVLTAWLLLGIRRGYWLKRPDSSGTEQAGASGRAGEGDTFVRSLLALWLVVGVLAVTVLSFALDDQTLRSTMAGALTASAGGALAYYFSTKASAEARKDFLEASMTGPTKTVPDLAGKTVKQAKDLFAENDGLRLKVDPATATDDQVIDKQDPVAKARVVRGSTVTVTVK